MRCSIRGCEEQASYRCRKCRRPVCSDHMVVHRGIPLGCVRCREKERQRTLQHVQKLAELLPDWVDVKEKLSRPRAPLEPMLNPKRRNLQLAGMAFFVLLVILIILGYAEGPLGTTCVAVSFVLTAWAATMPEYID